MRNMQKKCTSWPKSTLKNSRKWQKTTQKKKRKNNWSKKAKDKGYRVENDCVKLLKKEGYYALRIPTMLQVGELSKVDVIYGKDIRFVQCKYKKKYMSRRDSELLLYTSDKYNGVALLCYRDRGLHFEFITDLYTDLNRYAAQDIPK